MAILNRTRRKPGTARSLDLDRQIQATTGGLLDSPGAGGSTISYIPDEIHDQVFALALDADMIGDADEPYGRSE